ncbi:MAG: C25 family cysteine peptidase [Bacteroidota bacterium]
MKPVLIIVFLMIISVGAAKAQMWNGTDTLYGNEWIQEGQDYYKFKLNEDGLYRISYETLLDAGLPLDRINTGEFQLYRNGEQVPLFISSNGLNLQAGDFIEFYGYRNTADLDAELYLDPEQEQLNPYYSMFNDFATYFLTWDESPSLRYQIASNEWDETQATIDWHWSTLVKFYNTDAHQRRWDISNEIEYCLFDEGEGFGAPLRQTSQETFRLVGLLNEQEASIELTAFANNSSHQAELTWNGQTIYSINLLSGYQLLKVDTTIAANFLQNQNTLDLTGRAGGNDLYGLGSIKVRYPRDFNLRDSSHYVFELGSGANGNIAVTNFNGTVDNVVLYDFNNNTRIPAINIGQSLQWGIEARATDMRYGIFNTDFAKSISALEPVNWTDLSQSASNYIIITHSDLWEGATTYANYRTSQIGGAYNVQLVSIADIYNQFGFGIQNHPIALRNFIQYIHRNWGNLDYVFLMGHGFSYRDTRKGLNPNFTQKNHLPPYGYPGSDNGFFAEKGSVIPVIANGRLAVNNNEEILIYLNKVKAHEASFLEPATVKDQLWRKEIIHIVGGEDENERRVFKFYMKNMEEVVSANGYGGLVRTFETGESSDIDLSTTEQIIEDFNEGVGMKVFLGHGSVTTTEFGLDDPLAFDVNNRYPLLFSLGCLTGYLHDNQRSLSEDFILTPNRGGIGYVAMGGLAYASNLEDFSRAFYNYLGNDLFDAGMGDIMKRINETIPSNSIGRYSLLEQINFHGDPAIKMNVARSPDYTFDFESVALSSNQLNTLQDSFSVSFSVYNIGFNQVDTMALELKRTFPDGRYEIVLDTIVSRVGEMKMSYRLPIGGEEAQGENKIELRIDVNDEVSELPANRAESNNTLVANDGRIGYTFFIRPVSLAPLFPEDQGMIDQDNWRMVISMSDFIGPEKTLEWELDTVSSFDSPYKLSTTMTTIGGVVEWSPLIEPLDDQVYFWRVKESSLENSPWIDRSFVFEGEKYGWNQSVFEQLLVDSLSGLAFNREEEDLSYRFRLNGVTGSSSSIPGTFRTKYEYNNDRIYRSPRLWDRSLGVLYNCISISVFNPNTGEIVFNPVEAQYGSLNGEGVPYPTFLFLTDTPENRNNAATFMDEIIEEGYYVLFMTFFDRNNGDLFVEEWAADSLIYGKSLYSVLEKQGAQEVRTMATVGNLPYAFVYKKNEEPIAEELSLDPTVPAVVSFNLPSFIPNGSLFSVPVGPAVNWHEMEWAFPDNANDDIAVSIFGLTEKDGAANLLYTSTDLEGTYSLKEVNTSLYPYLLLQYECTDSVDYTPAIIDYWRVAYDPWDEWALSPGEDFLFEKDTLQQGKSLKLSAELKRIKGISADSIEWQFTIRSANNEESSSLQTIKAEGFNSTYDIELDQSTIELSGAQELIISADPKETVPEEVVFNNFAFLPFYVEGDQVAPALDVTFDGKHIIDGELVSASPFINISLLDDNDILQVEDTASFRIWVVAPDRSVQEIYHTDPSITFYSATQNNGRAKVEYQPTFAIDGTYTLRISARDASGNQSGGKIYESRFEVITQSQISNILPYPNPFTTSCRFVYTLTGSQQPTNFKLQIMTVSGRVVREIGPDEFGFLEFGTNLSDFEWDGTDQFGDLLANGVYLYRLIAEDQNGEQFKTYETGADKFFKEDFGKIVILR